MLLVVLLLAVGIGVFAYGAVSSVSLSQQQDATTRLAMTQVKNALIGWSAARTPTGALPNARPGELPCPDMNNDGFEDGMCVAGAIGRVPWKTLGIPEPKDGAGETLWYAIAGPFRIFNVNGDPIHSDTKGNLTVYQDSTASAITTEAVAVLFAPGAVFGAQNRGCTGDSNVPNCELLRVCTGPTYTTTALCNPANYLETAATINNSTTNGPFISAPSSDTFNDKVMAITTADLMPIVEQRVARELRAVLVDYKAKVGVYPWADCSNGGSDYGDNRGRIPFESPLPQPWGFGGSLPLPNWFTNKGATNYNWAWVIHYAVGRNFLEGGGVDCTMCELVGTGSPVADGTLFVDNVPGKEVVLVMTGPAGASRPGNPYVGDIAGPWGTVNWGIGNCEPVLPYSAWQAYLEDSENNDYNVNDRFVTPNATFYTHDRLYTIP